MINKFLHQYPQLIPIKLGDWVWVFNFEIEDYEQGQVMNIFYPTYWIKISVGTLIYDEYEIYRRNPNKEL